MGAFEYFQLAEALDAEPLWVINNGISHTYSVPAENIWPLVQVLPTPPLVPATTLSTSVFTCAAVAVSFEIHYFFCHVSAVVACPAGGPAELHKVCMLCSCSRHVQYSEYQAVGLNANIESHVGLALTSILITR